MEEEIKKFEKDGSLSKTKRTTGGTQLRSQRTALVKYSGM
jgi:hypothetical protein